MFIEGASTPALSAALGLMRGGLPCGGIFVTLVSHAPNGVFLKVLYNDTSDFEMLS